MRSDLQEVEDMIIKIYALVNAIFAGQSDRFSMQKPDMVQMVFLKTLQTFPV
jgi:hypothetical protein